MALPVKNFYGKIDGKTIYDFSRKLDYKIESQQERIKYVDELINTKMKFKKSLPDTYFEELFIQEYDEAIDKDKCYFDEEVNKYITYEDYIDKYSRESLHDGKRHTGKNISHVKLCLNSSDNLYSETNIAQELEKMADYILYAPDSEPITKKTEYKFYTEEKFQQRLNKDMNLEGVLSDSGIDDAERIDFLIRKGNNYKKEIKQKFKKSDLKDPDLKDIAGDYYYEREKLRKLIRDIKSGKNTKQYDLKKIYMIGNQINLLGKDLVDVKDQVKGTIYFKQPLLDEGLIDYDEFDFFDEEMVRELLKIKPRSDFQDDLACLTSDLECLIEQCNFSNIELDTIDMIRNNYDFGEIAKELNRKYQNVQSIVNKIIKQLINKYEDIYEDWYYLNIRKGKYKKCSKCGEIKIANARHFSPKKDGRDGLQAFCKECDAKRKQK